jgi:TRAP-type transport system small permease protein
MEAGNPPAPAAVSGRRAGAWRQALQRKGDAAAAFLVRGLGWLVIGAVVLNLANVLSRYLLARAILGAEELQVFVMVWVAFVGAAVVAWRGEHLRMDVLAQRFPGPLRTLQHAAEAVLLVVLAAFMLWQSWRFTAQMVQLDRRSDALGWPMALPHLALVTGFALLAVVAVLALAGIQARRAGHEEQQP